MNSIGGWEILLILIVMTAVIGPGNVKKLLNRSRTAIRKIRELGTELRDESGLGEMADSLKHDMESIKNETSEFKRQADKLVKPLESRDKYRR